MEKLTIPATSYAVGLKTSECCILHQGELLSWIKYVNEHCDGKYKTILQSTDCFIGRYSLTLVTEVSLLEVKC